MITGQMDIYECIAEAERDDRMRITKTISRIVERHVDNLVDELEAELGRVASEEQWDDLTTELVAAIEDVITEDF